MIPREFTPAYLQRAAEREERGLDPDEPDLRDEYADGLWEDEGE